MSNKHLTSNSTRTKNSVPTVQKALEKVDMSLVKGEMHNQWMTNLKVLIETLDIISASQDIEVQRLAYADFNDALYSAIKMFGTSGETIYYQYCPMARDNKGAFWLSAVEEINNPYFGDAMLTCGENKAVLK